MVAKVLDGKQIAKEYRQGLQEQVESLKNVVSLQNYQLF